MQVFTPTEIVVDDLTKPYEIHATGDWHLGARGCAENRLRATMERVGRKRNAIVLLMGDLGEFIIPSDNRFDPMAVCQDAKVEDLGDWADFLIDKIASVARPLRGGSAGGPGKIIGALKGNHENTMSVKTHRNLGRAIADRLGCRYLGYSGLFTLIFVEKSTKKRAKLSVFATHGAGNAATPGGKMQRLKKYCDMVDSDLVLMGHLHDTMKVTSIRLRQTEEGIGNASQLGVMTGTYLRTYSEGEGGYGEMKGYQATPIGHACITIIPATREMAFSEVSL